MQEIPIPTAYKKALREEILVKAMQMFANKGIRAVKMDDISTSLQISKRTLYELYSNKEDLLYECIKTSMSIRAEEMRVMAIGKNNVMDIIIGVFKQKVDEFKNTCPEFYTDIVKYPRVLKFLMEEKNNTHHQMIEFMHRGIAEGYFRENVNYDLLCKLLDNQSTFVMAERLYLIYSMQEILNNIIFVTIRGICTQKGLDVLDEFAEKFMATNN